MICDDTAAALLIERKPLKILWRDTCQTQVRIDGKAEAAVVSGIAENHASFRALPLQFGESRLDQRTPDALSLAFRVNRHGAKPKPPVENAVDHDWGESDMAYDIPTVGRDKRDRQRTCFSQPINDCRFVAVTVLRLEESGSGYGADKFLVLKFLGSYLHRSHHSKASKALNRRATACR